MKRKLSENYKRLEQRIAEACARAKRDSAEVKVVTVTKYVGLELIRTLVELGVRDLGENHAQELARRAAMLRESTSRRTRQEEADAHLPRWHMIGHLQRNKVRIILPWIEMIHSIDSLRLAEEVDAEAKRLDARMPILLQVNAAGETSKSGVAVAAATHLAEQITSLRNIELRGLMCMAPLTTDVTVIRHTFQRVRELFDEIIGERVGGPAFTELSMGMSNDFEIAIEFGATVVRIGSALFEGIELAPQPTAVE
ncbi:MAG: YggS family pyridoxal phosphate-dependent enzyme [Planctomycetota bacterium]